MNVPLTDPVARAASASSGAEPLGGFAAFVPELSVADLEKSLAFWCGMLGFEVAYDRPAARFAYLVRGPIQLMLCQQNGRWETGDMERPLGRGINFQMTVEKLQPILDRLEEEEHPLFALPTDAWYRVGELLGGQRECLVQDPDGYLVRLAEKLPPSSASHP